MLHPASDLFAAVKLIELQIVDFVERAGPKKTKVHDDRILGLLDEGLKSYGFLWSRCFFCGCLFFTKSVVCVQIMADMCSGILIRTYWNS